MGCRAFFDKHAGDSQKCKHLQNEDVETLEQWESDSASELSPGIVQDHEFLYQQIVDPSHIDPNGMKLKPTAFQDSANKGMSTHRATYIEWDELVIRGRLRAEQHNESFPERPARNLWGFARFKAADVRRITAIAKAGRHYFVYDTANADDRSHADICQGVASDKGVERSIRASLFDLAKDSLIQL